MASQGLFSIGGIASGLDTSNIIEQLLALERQPVARLERQQVELSRVKDAWGQINTKLSSLRAATDKINRVDRFDAFMSVTSSNPDAVSVTSSGTTETGSLSFTVQRLATRQQRSAGETFAARSDALGDRGLQITDAAGTVHDFTTTQLGPDATLDDLVAAVNDAGIGVKASALQIEPGQFRLVLDAAQTGEINTFSVASTGTWTDGFFAETQQALDAQLTVGGIAIERSSNTIGDLVDGATLTLRQTTATAVEVASARDVDGAATAVRSFTDALNGVLTTLGDLTKYDATSKQAGLLQGDASARRLGDSLRQAISQPIAGLSGADSLASTLGISFSRDGSLVVDEARIRQAFTDDFAGTAARLGRAGSTTNEAGLFLSATSTASPGTYGVSISQAAEVATVTGTAYVAPTAGAERTIQIARGTNTPLEITLDETHTTAESAAAHILDSLAAAGVSGFDITTTGGALTVSTVAYGSTARFTLTEVGGGDAFGLDQGERIGTDVVGTIDGQPATGSGRTLTGTTGAANGVSVQVTGQPADFAVTWSRGIVGQLGVALGAAEGLNGIVSRARQAVDRQVEIYQTRIDGFEQRLISREATIRRQFVGMETMLGQLNAQGNWLGQQLAGLNAQMQQ